MKILLVHNFYREPGGEDVVFAQERGLLERNGHTVIPYTRTNDEAADASALQKVRLLKTIVSASDSRNDIQRIVEAEKPDLAHVHNTFMMISPSIFGALAKAGVPVVLTVHNYRMMCPATYFFRDGKVCEECVTGGLIQGVLHACYRDSRAHTAAVATMIQVHRVAGTWANHVGAFIALTEFGKQKLAASGLPAERIHVKPNFVAQDPGQREGEGSFALFVGRLSPEKGAGTLVKAWSFLKSAIPLRIAGDGPELAELNSAAVAAGLTCVEFLGILKRPEVSAQMKGARFLIVPSIWYETFGLVIVEAFACGVPVLASRLGAMGELVTDGVTGLHFTAGSPEDLAEKVAWAWEHPVEMAAMGRNARLEYETKFRPESNYESLMAIYEKARAQTALAAEGAA